MRFICMACILWLRCERCGVSPVFQFVEETVAVDDVAHVRALADDSVTVFGFHAEREFTPLDCRQHGCGVHCLANGGRAQVRHIDMCPNSRLFVVEFFDYGFHGCVFHQGHESRSCQYFHVARAEAMAVFSAVTVDVDV